MSLKRNETLPRARVTNARDAANRGLQPLKCTLYARMAESADAADSKSVARESVRVQVPL